MTQDMTRIIKFSILLFVFSSCSPDKSEISGIYVAKNFKESIDTLIIYDKGDYYRSVYDKNNFKLIFRNNSQWNYVKGELVFSDFLLNSDELKFYNHEVNYENSLLKNHLPIRKGFSNIKIIINEDLNYYYLKEK